jgi:hypothetical protein
MWPRLAAFAVLVFAAAAAPAALGAEWRVRGSITPPDEQVVALDAATDAQGSLLSTWVRPSEALAARARPSGGSFEDPQEVSMGPVNRTALAVAPGGEAILAWVESGSRLLVASRGSDGRFGSPQVIVDGGLPLGQPAVALAPTGEAVLTWRATLSTGASVVRAATRSSGAEPFGAPGELGTGRLDDPVVGLDAQGRGLLAFHDFGAGAVVVLRHPPGGGFGDRQLLAREGLRIAGSEHLPVLEVAPSGAAVIAFTEGRPGRPITALHASGSFGTTSTGFRRHVTLSGPFARDLDVAIGPDDGMGVVWRANSGRFSKAQAAVRDPGDGFFTLFTRRLSGRNARAPQVVAVRGRVTVAWQRLTDRGRRVEATSQRHDGVFPRYEAVSRHGVVAGPALEASETGEQFLGWTRGRRGVVETAKASSRSGRFGRVLRVRGSSSADSVTLLPGDGGSMLLAFRAVDPLLTWRLATYAER